MTDIRIDHAVLAQGAADLRAAMAQIDSRLDQLERELAPLRSDWSGSQQQSYYAAKGQWDRAIQEMKQLLDDTQRAVVRSSDEYAQADRRGAAQFGG